jgi:hypothetical protein
MYVQLLPAVIPGRSLEPSSNAWPRQMIATPTVGDDTSCRMTTRRTELGLLFASKLLVQDAKASFFCFT